MITRPRRPGRLRFAIVALAAVLAGACTSAPATPAPGTSNPSAPATSPVATTPSTAPAPTAQTAPTVPSTAEEWAALLARSSVLVQTDEADATPLVPTELAPILRLTRFQLDNMVTEVADHGGILGSDVDVEIPMPDGAPPFSYLLAAWVKTTTTPAGDAIRAAMGPQDWEQAPTVVFPSIGIELFLAEMGLAAREPVATVMAPVSVKTAVFTPCSATAGFIQDALAALAKALKIDPSQFGSSVGGKFLGFLSNIWNVAVTLAQAVIQKALSVLSQAVIGRIRDGLAVLAVITILGSYLKPVSIGVEPAPLHTAFAIGDAPDVTGQFHARADARLAQWPEILVDCAKAVNFTLPEVAKPGSPVIWTTYGSSSGLIALTSPTTVALGDDRTAKLTYVTGRESLDQAQRGQLLTGGQWVSVELERTEITDLKATVEAFVLDQVPGGPIAQAVNPVLGPIVRDLINRAAGQLDSVFKVYGSGWITVEHHKPPEPTPSPSPSPSPKPTPRPTAPRPSPSATPTPPCIDGCGSSNGDPHMRTVDNHYYEFQAAGEYTLLRSADGSIEIQSRQEPPDPAKPVTVNTAIAARVNGHKVGVYLVGDALQLHIDGAVTTDAAPVDLGAGAMVQTHQHGYQVTFPDGTVLTLLSLSKWGINAIVKPSAALKTGGGLLGSVVPGGAELPALRDGTRLPTPTSIHETFQQTYGQLAPAWLVTSTTTLFDYDPGKDTSSYLIAGFPDEASLGLLATLPPELQAQARKACAAVTDPDLFDQCAFDFAVTSAVAYAQLYGVTANFVQNGTAALDQPAPSGPLPAGFFDIAPSLVGVGGSALGPTGTLYQSGDLGSDLFGVLAVDPATGTVLAHADAPSIGLVKVAAGSVWVGGIDANQDCMIQRLDAGTLSLQATIPVPCDITTADFTVLDDAVWFVDRTFDGGQTEAVRRIDPTTNQLDTEVALPFFNGFLGSTGSTMFYGDLEGNGYYRLHPGDSAFQPFGAAPADIAFGVTLGVVLAGDGYWVQHDQSAVFYSSSNAPDRTVPIDGTLTGADDQAVYVESSDPADGTSTLWRYPGDGSAPAQIGRGATVDGQDLGYFDDDPFLLGDGVAVKLWSVLSPSAPGPWELIEQYLPLP